jgi:colicin import membrane protein
MDLKEGRKKVYLLKGNLEQAAYNLIAASCKLTEEAFVTVEKAREIAQKKKEDELRVVRTLETAKYSEFMFSAIDLGKMSEEEYGKLLSGAKLQYQAKIDGEAKAELERIAKEKAEKEEQEKIRLENERLKAEAIERERVTQERIAKEEKERKAKEAAFEKKLKEESAKADAEAKKAKDIADKKLAAEKEKAAAEKKIADEKLKAEQEKAEALAAELKAKSDAEAKAQEKIRADKKAKEQEEKQAAKLSDSKKLEEWVNSIRPSYEIQGNLSKEGELLFQDISKKLLAFRTWSIDQLTKLK